VAGLTRRILDEIDREGPMPVARFMQRALYDPEDGYYTAGERRAGREWVTGPTLDPVFGRTLARGLAPVLAQVDDPVLVDAGTGGGELARDVAAGLADRAPDVLEELTVHLVDRSSAARERARTRFDGAEVEPASVRASAELPEEVRGVLLANELVDALPCHLCRARDGDPEEIFVVPGDPSLGLAAGEPSSDRVAQYAGPVAERLASGRMFEAPIAGLDWAWDAARRVREGALVLIDYGARRDELLEAHPTGTLHGYRKGQRVDEFWLDPGAMDLTYRVPFDALAGAGEEGGLETACYAPQGRVLDDLGIQDEASGDTGRVLAAKKLIDPDGAGGTFKVLAQTRGVDLPDAWPRGAP
jgi:SAM-dependent MidA family methyltransferase